MAVQVVKSFVPGIGEEEFAGLLAACLARRGYEVRAQVEHAGAAVHPGLHARLAESPTAQAFTWFRRTLPGGETGAIILDQTLAPWGRWDLELARLLSEGAGGLVGLMESCRSRGQYGLATFFCGRTIEAAGRDEVREALARGLSSPAAAALVHDDETVWAAFCAAFAAATGGGPRDLLWQGVITPRSWIVERREPAADVWGLGTPEAPWFSRALFAHTEADAFRAGVAGLAHGGDWRWLAEETAGVGVPYVLLERPGPLDEGLVGAIARRLDCFSLAMGLPAEDGPFVWLATEPGGLERRGQGQGAQALLDLWGRLSVTLGESPGLLRWPGRAPGLALP